MLSKRSEFGLDIARPMEDPVPTLPPKARSLRLPIALSAGLIVFTLVYLRWQGRVWWCACGHYWPISVTVNSPHNSQHLFDAYTFSHLLHGLLFFGLFWIFSDRISLGWRLFLSLLIECVWEMAENSPIVIDRYREGTVSLGYVGDSVINSVGDIVSMVVGFYLARWLGLWKSIAVIVAVEVFMVVTIRDNLTLNVLMLLWPIDAIRKWQSGG